MSTQKDTNKKEIVKNEEAVSYDLSYFLNELFEKTKRVFRALYYVTRNLNTNESIRVHLRESAHILFSLIQEDIKTKESYTFPHQKHIKDLLEKIHLYLLVLKDEEVINLHHYQLFERELFDISFLYEKVHSLLLEKREMEEEFLNRLDGIFDSSFFALNNNKEEQGKSTFSIKKDIKKKEEKNISQTQKKELSKKKKEKLISERILRKEERKKKIIQYLREHESATLPELFQLIGGGSQKTIQRDINELIQDGILLREGSRRWSRYILV